MEKGACVCVYVCVLGERWVVRRARIVCLVEAVVVVLLAARRRCMIYVRVVGGVAFWLCLCVCV